MVALDGCPLDPWPTGLYLVYVYCGHLFIVRSTRYKAYIGPGRQNLDRVRR